MTLSHDESEACVLDDFMPTHIYLSGPMRARDGFNFPEFFKAEAHFQACYPEADICNPAREDVVRFGLHALMDEDPTGLLAGRHLMGAEFGDAELRAALGGDLNYICQHCDLLVLLPGWEDSSGAKAEAATARAIGTQVWFFNTDPPTEAGYHDILDQAARGPQSRSEALDPSVDQGSTDSLKVALARSSQALSGETRATSATGGQKGVKLAAFDQISPHVEWELAEHFGMGARKYAAHNFRRGYPWSQSYSALRRHLAEFWSGKEYDECPADCPDFAGETRQGHRTCTNHTGSRHIIAALWHGNTLAEFSRFEKFKEYDDRYVYTSE